MTRRAAQYIVRSSDLAELLHLPEGQEIVNVQAYPTTLITTVTVVGAELPVVPPDGEPPFLPRTTRTRLTIKGPDGHEYHRYRYVGDGEEPAPAPDRACLGVTIRQLKDAVIELSAIMQTKGLCADKLNDVSVVDSKDGRVVQVCGDGWAATSSPLDTPGPRVAIKRRARPLGEPTSTDEGPECCTPWPPIDGTRVDRIIAENLPAE